MRFLVEMDDLYANAYKIMAREMGYESRQELVNYILTATMDNYPNFLQMARPDTAVKQAIEHHEREFDPSQGITVFKEDLDWAAEMLEAPLEAPIVTPEMISLDEFEDEKGLNGPELPEL